VTNTTQPNHCPLTRVEVKLQTSFLEDWLPCFHANQITQVLLRPDQHRRVDLGYSDHGGTARSYTRRHACARESLRSTGGGRERDGRAGRWTGVDCMGNSRLAWM